MFKKTLVILLTLLTLGSAALAENITFSWLPNSEDDLAGYKIYWGNQEGNYSNSQDVGLPPVSQDGRVYYTLQNVSGDTQYFCATAYDTEGHESDYSNVVQYNPKPNSPAEFQINITVNVEVH